MPHQDLGVDGVMYFTGVILPRFTNKMPEGAKLHLSLLSGHNPKRSGSSGSAAPQGSEQHRVSDGNIPLQTAASSPQSEERAEGGRAELH